MIIKSHSGMSLAQFAQLGFASVLCGSLLVSCQKVELKPQAAAKLDLSQEIPLYLSGAASSSGLVTRVVIDSPSAKQELLGEQAQISPGMDSTAAGADVRVIKTTKIAAGDALTLTWKDTWRAGLNFELANPMDLSGYLEKGVIELDVNLQDLTKGGFSFKTKCGANCERQMSYILPAREMVGKGWQHLGVPLSCFKHDGDLFNAVTVPFAFETGGAGSVSFANVKLKKNGQANVSCLDYKTLSVTPSMLNEWWSIDWWQPRHEQKLAEAKANPKAQVVFIGDSITQGWEKDGFNVWNKNYKKYQGLALGFGGDRTENVLWRLLHGEVDGLNPKVAVLMFGTNNTGHRYEEPNMVYAGIKRNIEELQKRLPNTKILLLAIFPRDEKPSGALRQNNEKINALLPSLADNKHVYFLNINQAFLTEDGTLTKDIMPDLLHPNDRGYEIWAKAMEPTLLKLMK